MPPTVGRKRGAKRGPKPKSTSSITSRPTKIKRGAAALRDILDAASIMSARTTHTWSNCGSFSLRCSGKTVGDCDVYHHGEKISLNIPKTSDITYYMSLDNFKVIPKSHLNILFFEPCNSHTKTNLERLYSILTTEDIVGIVDFCGDRVLAFIPTTLEFLKHLGLREDFHDSKFIGLLVRLTEDEIPLDPCEDNFFSNSLQDLNNPKAALIKLLSNTNLSSYQISEIMKLLTHPQVVAGFQLPEASRAQETTLSKEKNSSSRSQESNSSKEKNPSRSQEPNLSKEKNSSLKNDTQSDNHVPSREPTPNKDIRHSRESSHSIPSQHVDHADSFTRKRKRDPDVNSTHSSHSPSPRPPSYPREKRFRYSPSPANPRGQSHMSHPPHGPVNPPSSVHRPVHPAYAAYGRPAPVYNPPPPMTNRPNATHSSIHAQQQQQQHYPHHAQQHHHPHHTGQQQQHPHHAQQHPHHGAQQHPHPHHGPQQQQHPHGGGQHHRHFPEHGRDGIPPQQRRHYYNGAHYGQNRQGNYNDA